MRTIEFRGWSPILKRWLFGCYCVAFKRHFINRDVDVFEEYEQYEVIPESVGQFTGMYDKNGVKIFEGDIVRSVETNKIFSIHYSDLRGGFKRRADEDYVMTWGKELTVVGNAYEGAKE